MKNLLTLLALLTGICHPERTFSQTEKGASPLAAANSNDMGGGATYAVVVGISDYQDEGISDLRFADRDAEAFTNFLRSPAGGSLDGDHLKLLTNSDATLGKFAAALDWLLEVSKMGDLVILYFSGHGDVDKKSITQPGYLLCWDAPSKIYMGGGTLALPMFQDVVTTLSVQNKAKVVVIADACRSGKLAGSSVGGAQITGSNLARQFANEIKILSCQPNEYSIEGEQWGGGRGAFSFNLVNALYGMADVNSDLYVTLQEVSRYLEDHVTIEVAPVSQVPMVIGNRNERLAIVDPGLLAAMRSGTTNQMVMLSAVESRGMEDEVLAVVDTTTRELYRLFKKALKAKVFQVTNKGTPATATADAYYVRLMAEPKMQRLHSTMTRNYATALQDDAQQVLNEWLKTSQEVSLGAVANGRMPQQVFTEKVRSFPHCLDRAAELLGEKHYMYAALKARKYFFEGYLLANSDRNPNQELGERALALFRQSLDWQPEQPHVYWQMSQVFGWNLMQPDSLEHYARRTMEIYPNWTTPCTHAAYLFTIKFMQLDRAKPFLEQANRIDSNSVGVLHYWAIFNFHKGKIDQAELQLRNAIALDSTEFSLWCDLGYLYNRTRRYEEAEMALKKAVALDSTAFAPWNNLGYLYNRTRRYEEAEASFKKAIALDSTSSSVWNNLGNLYNRTQRYEEAEASLKKAIALDSTDAGVWNDLGYLYLGIRRYAESEQVFKKTIALDSLFANPYKHLGMVYFKTNQFEDGKKSFLKAIALDPDYWQAILGMTYVLAAEGKTDGAIDYLEQAIGKGATIEQLVKDENLSTLLGQTEQWKTLLKKYFPDQAKD